MAVISVPSLGGLLAQAEWRKGSPLTKEEVEEIRDITTLVQVPDNIARGMDLFCGYGDVDPQKCWETWQRYRTVLRVKTA
ncbi:hypothetical protein [Erwinia sp.]|uniref:hypothetical protein n=1 Tax=Erwinia citreus TaxID=558 RepID=UPI0028A1358B|nr:hypothetical protein [Erwinia sp.]